MSPQSRELSVIRVLKYDEIAHALLSVCDSNL
jgi:hypothetical protein